jgi:hypothetical protein
MQASEWIEMLQHIPPEFHDGLTFQMANGLEINMQQIFRLEENYIVCRGRKMGSADAGETFFVPYDGINCIAYSKLLKEQVIQSWFPGPPAHPLQLEAPGEVIPTVGTDEAEQEAVAEPAPEDTPAATAPAAPAAPPPAPAAPQPAASRPVIPPRPAVPPRPAPAAPPPAASVPLSGAGMPSPAKAAMLERLRKKQPPGSSSGANPAKPGES